MRFDFDEVFGDDYLHFAQFTDEQNDRDADDIVRLLDLGPGDTVLDASCGHGRISGRLAWRGLRVTGVDASERFLDLARSAAVDPPGPAAAVDYRLGDLRRLPEGGEAWEADDARIVEAGSSRGCCRHRLWPGSIWNPTHPAPRGWLTSGSAIPPERVGNHRGALAGSVVG